MAILLNKEGVNKLKRLLKLGRRNGTPKGLGKMGFRVPFIQKGLYLKEGIVNIFKNKI